MSGPLEPATNKLHAVRDHQAGQLPLAEAIYRQILADRKSVV